MDFDTAVSTLPPAKADAIRAIIARLPSREQQAICTESRLPSMYWQAILDQLMLLTPTADIEEVRLAFSAALENVYLTGPEPHPKAGRCERALDFERLFGFYRKVLVFDSRSLMQHFDDWGIPANPAALHDCIRLVGHLRTGLRPTWGVPFAAGEPRPLQGLSAGEAHARLALWPPGELKPIVVMSYALPEDTRQTVPTIGDAFQWSDDRPHWRYLFLPAAKDETLGRTAPVEPGLAGFPEIVHEPVELRNLLAPLERRI